jgi:hypothetical protein
LKDLALEKAYDFSLFYAKSFDFSILKNFFLGDDLGKVGIGRRVGVGRRIQIQVSSPKNTQKKPKIKRKPPQKSQKSFLPHPHKPEEN